MTDERIDTVEGYMTSKQAAEYLHRTDRLICILCKDGKLAGAKKIGNLWLIPEDTVKIYEIVHGKKKDNTKEKI